MMKGEDMRKIALLITLLLLAYLALVACGGQAQTAVEDAVGEEALATAAAAIGEVAPTVEATVEDATPTVEVVVEQVVATEEPTTEVPSTPEPTATPTPTPTPESTPTPIPTPTELPEGMVTYRYTFPDGNVVEAAIPEGFLGALSVASHEVGSVDGVDFANLQIEGDAVLIGDIPVFLRVNDGWQINPEVRAIDYGVNEVASPALALTIRTQSDPGASSRLDPTKVHMIQVEDFETNSVVSVYPAYIESVELISVAVPLDGQAYQRLVALTTFTYLNSSGAVTRCQAPLYEGVVVKNKEGTPLEEIYDLFSVPLSFHIYGNFEWPPDNVQYVLMDISDAAVDPYEIQRALGRGGLISLGQFGNVSQMSH